MKQLPEVVDDFFGRGWVREFCGPEAADLLGDRLDAVQVAQFRREMWRFYAHVFNVQDPGLLITDTPGAILRLEDRYVVPDVLDRRSINVKPAGGAGAQDGFSEGHRRDVASTPPDGEAQANADRPGPSETFESRRPIDQWLAANDHAVVLGGPGGGKSTLLRFLAIDLLSEEPQLATLTEKWGNHLPLWVPFPRWTRMIAQGDSPALLTDMLRMWLAGWNELRLWPLVDQALKDRRLLLFVDGLDEYTNMEAAGIAIDRLRVFVDQRQVPAILASRPHGFRRLGLENSGWEIAELAGFNAAQQKRLARIWYNCRLARLGAPAADPAELERRASAEADGMVSELAESPDLRELAEVPLLLSLLILQRMHDGYLPTNRFRAYEQLVDLLTAKHPARRRKAAEVTDPGLASISDEEARQVLAHLAYQIQARSPEGLIDRDEAREIVRGYLRDPDHGLNFAEREARGHAGRLLDVNVETTGILVSRSQTEVGYFHRTAQEYLAACYLAELPLGEQVGVVQTNCTDPRWREILLCLFHLTRRPDDVGSFVEAIRKACVNPVDRLSGELLLTEVAFGSFHCPNSLMRELATSAYASIEAGSWMPHREAILRRVLGGLRSARARGLVEAKVPHWFPARLPSRAAIYRAMARWPREPEVLDCLRLAIQDEDIEVQREAAEGLVELAKGETAIGDFLAHAASHADMATTRAAALKALSRGWPEHSSLRTAIEAARKSVSPELRIAAIAVRIQRAEHTPEDREELLRLGTWSWSLDYHWRAEVPSALVAGWRGDAILKRACLVSADRNYHREGALEINIAMSVLLEAFPGDEDVAEFCVDELRREHPFVTQYFEAWRLIAENYRDHPAVVKALDDWAAKQRYDVPQIAMASLTGRTEAMKQRLIVHLNDSSVPHWVANALIEGWGMEDPEVAVALRTVATGPADLASRIGSYLPEIFGDSARCRDRLLSILGDTTCHRADFVLEGLMKLETVGDVEAVETILALLPDRPGWRTNMLHTVYGRIIDAYGWEPRIRALAMQELAEREGRHAAVARNYGDDPNIRAEILRHANPLPARLRVRIAKDLKPGAGSEEFLLPLLRLYDREPDGGSKTEASISYHRAIRTLGKETEAVVEALREGIVATGLDYEARRQAAFAGLVAIDRVGDFLSARDWNGERPRLTAKYVVTTNHALLRFILENWDRTGPICHEAFEWGDGSLWETLCVLADEYPAPREDAIRYFEARADEHPKVNELRFLARVRPGSGLLLHKCMKALQIDETKHQAFGSEAVAAAEILGSHFSNDEEVRRRIIAAASPNSPLKY